MTIWYLPHRHTTSSNSDVRSLHAPPPLTTENSSWRSRVHLPLALHPALEVEATAMQSCRNLLPRRVMHLRNISLHPLVDIASDAPVSVDTGCVATRVTFFCVAPPKYQIQYVQYRIVLYNTIPRRDLYLLVSISVGFWLSCKNRYSLTTNIVPGCVLLYDCIPST